MYDTALDYVPDDAFETGVSVFEIDKNGLPILSNLQLVSSLLSRLDHKAFEITGEKVGIGNDGEPLVSNITILKQRRIKKEKLINHVLKVLLSNFKTATYDETKNHSDNSLLSFYVETKINIKTGERVSIYEDYGNYTDYIRCPSYDEYIFNGWEFSNPVDTFPTQLGYKSGHYS
jgi:hypothetical protein